jgi:hypothetical protein
MADKMQTYDSSQVREQALPNVQQSSVATPDFLAEPRNQDLRLGGAALRAGNAAMRVAGHMQDKENLSAVQDATTAYGEAVLKFQTEAKKNRIMGGAAGITGEFSDFHQKTIDEIAKGLTNNAQRQAFTQTARRAGLSSRREIATFEIGETAKAQQASFEANKQTYIDLGAAASTPEAAREHKEAMVNSTRAYWASRNADKVTTDAMVTAATTQFHAQRIQELARIDGEAAAAYFKENKHEIAGSQRDKIGEFADKAGAEGVGLRKSDDIWTKHGPKNDTTPIELDKMLEAARNDPALKNNPAALNSTISRIKERVGAMKDARSERSDGLRAGVNQAIMDGRSLSQIRGMPQFMALDNTTQLAIVKDIEAINASRAARGAAAEARADAAESRAERRLERRGAPLALNVSDPDVLLGMTRNQVVNLRESVGVDETKRLLAKWDMLKANSTKVIEARIDHQDFQRAMIDGGLNPFSRSQREKTRLVRLQAHIENVIDVAQRARGDGKQLSREEKREIAKREVANDVINDSFFGLTDRRAPAGMVSDEDRQTAYVLIGPTQQRVNIADIPDSYRKEITFKRARDGRTTTEEQLAELWARKTGTFKDK